MQSARVVVIGGGAVGCSALYHLTRLGWTDVVLLERDELTAGSTWHAAGNCPNFSTSWTLLRLQRYSTTLYETLATESAAANADAFGYHLTGSIRLAHTADRVDEFRHVAAQARAQRLDFELLGPAEIRARYPFLRLDGLQLGLWDPKDGDIDPAQLTQALARAARDRGAAIHRHTRVTGLSERADGGWRIETSKGPFEAEYVINAGGYRGGEVAALVGEYLPIVSLSHQYLITEDIPELGGRGQTRLPLLRDPDASYYLRQERHGLLLGPYESQPRAPWQDGIPSEFAQQLFADELERIEPYIAAACARVPLLGTVGVKRVVNGPIPYTPDGNPLIGPAVGVRNLYHCCAFTFGIAQAGGAGRVVAEWVVNGEPDWDVWCLDPRRYLPCANRTYALAKALETYQKEYAVGYPQEERPAGRPLQVSPLHERLRAEGAVFGARGAWERALYYAQPDDPPTPTESFRRCGWQRAVARECAAVADGLAVMDLPGFARFAIEGAGAADWLDHLITGQLPREGRVALSYLCSSRGTIVSEMTVTHLQGGLFWLMSGAAAERHDEEWLHQHLSQRYGPVTITNVSSRLAALIIAGPRSRELLSRISDADLSNAAFPWLSVRRMKLASKRESMTAIAIRASYSGELGWELHVPTAQLAALYQCVRTHGRELGLRHFGLYALESLRLEKCYRSWKADLTSEHTPLEASLERFVRLDKSAAFIGREALRAQQAAGVRQRFVPLLVEAGDADAAAVSIVYRGRDVVGTVSSGGYGHRLKRSIALAYVRADLALPGAELEVEILGERRPALVAREPLYDPHNLRVQA